MKKFAHLLTFACLTSAPLVFASPAAAQFAKPEDAIKYRQSALALMGAHMGRLAPVVRGQKPFDAAEVKADVELLVTLAKLPWGAFGPGTEGGKARPEVWSDNAKFKQAAERVEGDIAKLAAAARSGDLAQVRTAYGAVGASCKNCHDSFRAR